MSGQEPKKFVQLGTRVPADFHKKIKLLCVERDISIQDFVNQALREKYEKESSKK